MVTLLLGHPVYAYRDINSRSIISSQKSRRSNVSVDKNIVRSKVF